ncbi:hypothetical protein LWI28_021597 [Acer negundo]|uniref:RNase H type-1 domain-containing protein n=1 Tax=Acer negundo TaxID=4023 RepID=A0AAD5IT64_ACENE|nr:hypothetical protein LWI28_021597 [Acer negundo]
MVLLLSDFRTCGAHMLVFLTCVEEAWNKSDSATLLWKLAISLKRTKLALRAWNKNTFGRVELWEHREATRLNQIAKKTWLLEGDQNTRFFHSVINQRRKQGFISHIVLSNERVLENAEAVHQGATNYFHDFLIGRTGVETADLSSLINPTISEDENKMLCIVPSEEEVKDAISSIPKHISPSPDGFDDILIFVNGGKRSIRRLVEILGVYESWSRQVISKEMSALFPSKHISSSRTCSLLRLTGFREGKFPVTYLGAPLMSGRLTTRIIDPFVEQVRNKVASFGGTFCADRLTELVGEEATLDILHNSRAGKSGPDLFVWTPSNDGRFSTSSAWEVVRKKVDERVQARRVALTLACDCCVRKSGESLDHILCIGETATKLPWKSGSSGGGGVIRDDVDTVWVGYSAHFGHGTNNGTELRAITEGFMLCRRLNLFNVIIESDSKVVVDWLRAGKCTLWYLWHYWDDLLKPLERVNFMVVHHFREANQATDFLAWQGELSWNLTYEGYQNLPRFSKGVFHIDKLGFPCLRT